MGKERIQKITNWDEKLLSFPKDSMIEMFVNDEGLLDICISNHTLPKWERPFKDDPEFDMFTDKQMKHAQQIIGNQQTFVTFSGLPFDGFKQKFLKTLMLILSPPGTIMGRRMDNYKEFDE